MFGLGYLCTKHLGWLVHQEVHQQCVERRKGYNQTSSSELRRDPSFRIKASLSQSSGSLQLWFPVGRIRSSTANMHKILVRKFLNLIECLFNQIQKKKTENCALVQKHTHLNGLL